MEIVIRAENENGNLFYLNANYEQGIVYNIRRYNKSQHITNSCIPIDFSPHNEYLTADIDKDNFLSNVKANQKPNTTVNKMTLFLLLQHIIVR